MVCAPLPLPFNVGMPIKRAMGYNPYLTAREHFERLRAFNHFYGYFEDNNNLPLPEDVPADITIAEYEFQNNAGLFMINANQ